MQMKLAILAAGQLLSYIKAKLQDSVFKELEVSITALDYRNFSYISQLYTEIELDYDGFLICGTAAYHALEKGCLLYTSMCIRDRPYLAIRNSADILAISMLQPESETR